MSVKQYNIIVFIIIALYIILLQASVFHCLNLSNIYHLGMNFHIFSIRVSKEIFIYRAVLLLYFGAGAQVDDMSMEIFQQSP